MSRQLDFEFVRTSTKDSGIRKWDDQPTDRFGLPEGEQTGYELESGILRCFTWVKTLSPNSCRRFTQLTSGPTRGVIHDL